MGAGMDLFQKLVLDYLPTVMLIILGYAAFVVYLYIRKKSEKTKVVVFLAFFVPAGFLAFCISLTYFGNAATLVRLIIIACGSLLPALLFLMFLATRRESLFNAYTAQLDRLGLLRCRIVATRTENGVGDEKEGRVTYVPIETETGRRRRVTGYLERFGAVYGTVPSKTIIRFLNATSGLEVMRGGGLPESASLKMLDDDPSGLDTKLEATTQMPIIVATILITTGWVTALPPFNIHYPAELMVYSTTFGTDQVWPWFATLVSPSQTPVSYAFLGAYFFSLQMLVRRYVRRDIGHNAFNSVTVRVLLSTIAVWVVQQGLASDTLEAKVDPYLFLVAAFVIGTLPQIVWQFAGDIAKRLFGWALPSLKSGIPLTVIDGLTIWHEARFEEEDIENVANLATADIAELMLSTKFPPHRVVDWIDQAILINHICDDRDGEDGLNETAYKTLRRCGLKSSSHLVSQYKSDQLVSLTGIFTLEQLKQFGTAASAMELNPNYGLVASWRGLIFGTATTQVLVENQ